MPGRLIADAKIHAHSFRKLSPKAFSYDPERLKYFILFLSRDDKGTKPHFFNDCLYGMQERSSSYSDVFCKQNLIDLLYSDASKTITTRRAVFCTEFHIWR